MAGKATREKLPALPTSIDGALGPITVVRAPDRMAAHNEYGHWVWHTRTIVIDATLVGRAMWHTFYHECAHAAFDDAGIKWPTKELEESACDALAAARVRERFG